MAEFFNVGGYGFYVGWSFGMTAALIVIEWIMSGMQHKSILSKLRRIARMHETQEQVR